jgi:hypothetical protein
MCRWEEHVLNNLPGPKPRVWFRYIDDIFGIWDGSLKDLNEFIKLTNDFDKDIQISCSSSLSDIQFLDVIIYKTYNSQLASMVYLKPTSSLRLIHPNSLHPKHTKYGVISSQVLRFLKNCNFESDFKFHLKSLFNSLKHQGYTHSALRQLKHKALSYTNYGVNEEGRIIKGFLPCTNRCGLCLKHGVKHTSITYSGGGKIITQNLSCSVKNAIYIIYCLRCSIKYVGETGNSVKQRLSQHLSTIKLKRDTTVSEHFNKPDHSIDDLRFFVLANNTEWSLEKRRSVESKWINKLNTLKPNGMNTDVNHTNINFVTIPFTGTTIKPFSLTEFLNESFKTSYTIGSPLRVTFNHKHIIARN